MGQVNTRVRVLRERKTNMKKQSSVTTIRNQVEGIMKEVWASRGKQLGQDNSRIVNMDMFYNSSIKYDVLIITQAPHRPPGCIPLPAIEVCAARLVHRRAAATARRRYVCCYMLASLSALFLWYLIVSVSCCKSALASSKTG